MEPLTRRQLIRGLFALSIGGATGALLAACGQPDAAPVVGGLPALPTPARTPTAGADTQETPIPVPFPGVTATTGYPTPASRPTTNPTVAYLPQTRPTPRPEDPYGLCAAGHHLPNTALVTEFSTLIVIGAVSQLFPSQWSTVDGQRPANPHISPPQYTIYRPVEFEIEQTLKGTPVERLYLIAHGGAVGQDSVCRSSDGKSEFSVGERALLFLFEPIGYLPRIWNSNQLWGILQHYTITADGQAKNFYRTVPLQQLLAEIAAAQPSR